MCRSVASEAGSRQCGPEGGGSGVKDEEEEEEEAADDDDLDSWPLVFASSLALFLFAFSSGPGVDFVLMILLALVHFRAWAICVGIRDLFECGQLRLNDDDDDGGGAGRCAGFATLAGPEKRRDDIESQVSVAECASCWRGSDST